MVELDQPRSTDVMGGDFMWTTSAEKKREGKKYETNSEVGDSQAVWSVSRERNQTIQVSLPKTCLKLFCSHFRHRVSSHKHRRQ